MKVSNARYYQRRYAEELVALRRAVTPEAAARRTELVLSFAEKLKGLGVTPAPSPPASVQARAWILELD